MVATAHRIGTYLGRPVWCAAVDRAADLSGLGVEGNLALLHTGDRRLVSKEREELANQIIQSRPLAMFFTGADAAVMFDVLLRALDAPTDPIPMMTNFSCGGLAEAVDEFLTATWPPDERWDEWQGYLLVEIGGPIALVEAAASQFLKV